MLSPARYLTPPLALKGLSLPFTFHFELLRVFSLPEMNQVSFSYGLLSVSLYTFIFSTTTGPILTRLGTNHPWGQVSSNEEEHPSPRRDNSKRVQDVL
jgi:hypothetical protein